MLLPIPWRHVESWNCNKCGMCCKGFDVVLDFPEWINIIKDYGINYTRPGISRLFLQKTNDDTCVFLNNYHDNWLCGLQYQKPIACKLWPFKISNKPQFGKPSEAAYELKGMKLFIYVDSSCPGLRWGNPNPEFTNAVLPEFIDIALGQRRKQFYSTAKPFQPQQWKLI